ncbi:hypothetical protein QOZ80_8BG0663410 [Eleusine coracana subsp. coracana]|nr:hypothetical protein QOZ80_8BG0663410 [Eleusine coracana subsp. coracana]
MPDNYYGYEPPSPPRPDHHDRLLPRLQKWEFPKYDGTGDPLPFLGRCESYFHAHNTRDADRVALASYNLLDKAHIWYRNVIRQEGTPTWTHFNDLLNMRYGPPIRSNPLGELAACRRTASVEDYQERFLDLLARAGPLSPE